MKEKTGFESTQELPLSNKDIQLIIDSLRYSIAKMEYEERTAHWLYDKEAINIIRERKYKMQNIISKLNHHN